MSVAITNSKEGSGGPVAGIVEELDTDDETRAVREINVGVYAVEASWLWGVLNALPPSPSGGAARQSMHPAGPRPACTAQILTFSLLSKR